MCCVRVWCVCFALIVRCCRFFFKEVRIFFFFFALGTYFIYLFLPLNLWHHFGVSVDTRFAFRFRPPAELVART